MATVTCPNCGRELITESSDEVLMFCEYCGAKINLNINLNYNFNYSKSEHTEHIVDDAKIKNADNANRVIGIFATPFEEYKAKKEHQRRLEEDRQRFQQEQTQEWYQKAEERSANRAERRAQWESENFPKIRSFILSHKKETIVAVTVCILLLIASFATLPKIAEHNRENAAHRAELAQLEAEKITYSHIAMGELQIPSDLPTSGDYQKAVKALESSGFTNISCEPIYDLIIGYSTHVNDIEDITIGGSSTFKKSTWYPSNVSIIIRYHTYREEIQQKKDAVVEHITDTITDTVNEQFDNAIDAVGNKIEEKINSLFSDEPSTGTYAFLRKNDEGDVYFYIDFDGSRVYMYTIGKKAIKQAYVFSITKGNYDKGIAIHNEEYDVSYELTFKKNHMTIHYPDGDTVTLKETDADEAWKLYRDNY